MDDGVALAQYSNSRLVIFEELGYQPLEPQAGHLFFQLISRHCEQSSVLINSNHPIEELDALFSDQVVLGAMLDRLLHQSHVVKIRGVSYRLWKKLKSELFRPQRAAPHRQSLPRKHEARTFGATPPTSTMEIHPAKAKTMSNRRQRRTSQCESQLKPPALNGPEVAHFSMSLNLAKTFEWVAIFVSYYNYRNLHSNIKLATPH